MICDCRCPECGHEFETCSNCADAFRCDKCGSEAEKVNSFGTIRFGWKNGEDPAKDDDRREALRSFHEPMYPGHITGHKMVTEMGYHTKACGRWV